MVPLVKKLVHMVKMVMPLVPMVQMLPTNGTIGRTPNTCSIKQICIDTPYGLGLRLLSGFGVNEIIKDK